MLIHVLSALTAVIVCGAILAKLCRWIGQPPVIGQVLAGIALGPSLLGRISLDAQQALLPAEAIPLLGVLAQFGIILYMFLLGLELDTEQIRQNARPTLIISASSIAVPFLLGGIMAVLLHSQLSSPDVAIVPFALFVGVALAVTAFPVLARILHDRGMQATPLGTLALSCAAVNDVIAWCLLALVVGVAQAKLGSALGVIAGAVVFIGFMLTVLRPLARRFATRVETTDQSRQVMTIVFLALLLCALMAEWIGIHAIFGAFLLGVIIPHDSRIARSFTMKLEDLVTVVFLPAFFAFTGMRTQIGALHTVNDWLFCGLIIVVATVGKVAGTALAARATGMPGREAGRLGALMNTRGLMELIILNIGLDLKIISPTFFAMMVIMAVATTMMTGPLLNLLARKRRVDVADAPCLDAATGTDPALPFRSRLSERPASGLPTGSAGSCESPGDALSGMPSASVPSASR